MIYLPNIDYCYNADQRLLYGNLQVPANLISCSDPFVVRIGVSSEKLPTSQSIYLPFVINSNRSPKLLISTITDNRSDFPNKQVQKFEKFEITFDIENSIAPNPQFPYDPSPPSGIDLSNPSYQGITVKAVFTPDNWQTTYVQPAFFIKNF
jgi:hypothetical protein